MYKSYHHVQQTLFKDASSFNERKLDSLKSLKSMKNVILCLTRDGVNWSKQGQWRGSRGHEVQVTQPD